MYEVKLINNGIETIINAVSTNIDAPRITGSIKQGINCIDSFSFIIYPNNPGYNLISPLKTLVSIINTKTNEVEFCGRVLLQVPKMSSTGEFIISATCESELGFLNDSFTRYGEYHDTSVRDFLEIIINNHNNQVSEDKHFKIGIVDVESNLYRFMKYEQSLNSIKDNLLDRLGGEIRVRYENGIRYLDYLKQYGSKKDTEIRISKNLLTLEQEKDPTQIITRLIPLGTKLDDSEERLTVKGVNDDKDYIDDIEAIELFGIIEGSKTWDDVTLASNLLTKGQQFLIDNNKIKKKHKVESLDLSLIDLDIDSLKVGNIYKVINPVMNIDEELRIIEKNIDINSPHKSSLTIGDKFEDIKTYQANITKTQKSLSALSSQVASVTSNVIDVSNSLQSTNDNLMNTTTSLQQTTEALVTTNNVLINTNEKLEKIKRRLIMGV